MASFVTNNGLAEFVNSVVVDNVARFLQWGEGSGQDAADNAIASAGTTTESRTAGVMSQETENTTGDTIQVVGTITALGTRAITEVGVFDAAGTGNPPSGADLIAYGDFSVVNLSTNDSVTFTVRLTLDQA